MLAPHQLGRFRLSTHFFSGGNLVRGHSERSAHPLVIPSGAHTLLLFRAERSGVEESVRKRHCEERSDEAISKLFNPPIYSAGFVLSHACPERTKACPERSRMGRRGGPSSHRAGLRKLEMDTSVRHPALRLAAGPVRQFYTVKEGLTDRPHRRTSDRRIAST